MKAKRFNETLPIRVEISVDRRVSLVARATGLTKSDIIRIAIKSGLPLLEAGKLPFNTVAAN
jgi:predicted DNA-binding protein